jgi:hypothetical protein
LVTAASNEHATPLTAWPREARDEWRALALKIEIERKTAGPVKTKIDRWDEEKLRAMQPQPKESGSKRRRGEAIDEGEAYYGEYANSMRLFTTAATPEAEDGAGLGAGSAHLV